MIFCRGAYAKLTSGANMQKPGERGAPADNARFDDWLASFTGYASQVTRRKIELWLEQFDSPDRDVAARVLDAVLFIGNEQIKNQFRGLLKGLDGWDEDPRKRKGRWFFVAFSTSAGESGDTMLHMFRMATGMTQRKFNSLFVRPSELIQLKLTADDTVILIDDFAGTGKQATDAWTDVFSELLAGEPRTFLMLAAATKQAMKAVADKTEMELLCGIILEKRQNFFDATCTYFNGNEKKTVEHYCRKADAKYPRGSGDSGLLVVLTHRCPNNSLPILHATHRAWRGLFPRAFED